MKRNLLFISRYPEIIDEFGVLGGISAKEIAKCLDKMEQMQWSC